MCVRARGCVAPGCQRSQGRLGDGVWRGDLCASIISVSGVRREGGTQWTDSRLDSRRSDDEGRASSGCPSKERRLLCWRAGRQAQMCHASAVRRPPDRPKGGTPAEFLDQWMAAGMFLVCTMLS